MDFPDLSSQRFLTLLFIETYCHEKFTIHQPTAAIMGLLIVIGVGCSKVELHDQVKVHEAEFDRAGLITRFAQKMDDHKKGVFLKSSETIQIDSAIWYIDATLNYHYAMANYPCARFHWDTVFVEMNVLDSYEAMYAEVFEAYDSTLFGISDKYYEIEEDEKQFLMAMVEDMGSLPNNKRNLRIITVTGTGELVHTRDFGQGEAYLWDRDADTDCDGVPSLSAPKIFESLLNPHFNPEPGNNCRWYFYGFPTFVIFDYADYPSNQITPPNYLDYKIFHAYEGLGNITDITECLEWNQHNLGIHEMTFYFDNLIDIIQAWMDSGQNTENKKYDPLSTINSIQLGVGNEKRIYHEPEIHFKKRGLICDTPIIIPER